MDILSLAHEHILIVEDDPVQADYAARFLAARNAEPVIAENVEQAIEKLRHYECTLALLDYQLPDGTGLDVLQAMLQIAPDTPAIMLTKFSNTPTAVKAMQLGAIDFLEKPYTFEALEVAINRALNMNALRREAMFLRREVLNRKDVPVRGSSEAMAQLWKTVEQIAPSNSSALLIGENGTGKEVIARAIHTLSKRSHGPFIAVNCGGMTETLIEDQLFGHEPFSFTDARALRRGDFELAHTGTLFLDEIGELPLKLQPNLLRALDQRSFYRIGGEREIKVDTRVIAATLKDLEGAIENNEFRRDLYYRLNVITLRIPPLRERPEDIPLFTAYFMATLGRELGKPKCKISESALRAILQYHWPGNIRQLRNIIERALIMCPGSMILPEHLAPELTARSAENARRYSPDDHAERWIDAMPYRQFPAIDTFLASIEKIILDKTVAESGGVRKEAAAKLGLTPDILRHRLRKYHLADTLD